MVVFTFVRFIPLFSLYYIVTVACFKHTSGLLLTVNVEFCIYTNNNKYVWNPFEWTYRSLCVNDQSSLHQKDGFSSNILPASRLREALPSVYPKTDFSRVILNGLMSAFILAARIEKITLFFSSGLVEIKTASLYDSTARVHLRIILD